jgi:hypothetical protein
MPLARRALGLQGQAQGPLAPTPAVPQAAGAAAALLLRQVGPTLARQVAVQLGAQAGWERPGGWASEGPWEAAAERAHLVPRLACGGAPACPGVAALGGPSCPGAVARQAAGPCQDPWAAQGVAGGAAAWLGGVGSLALPLPSGAAVPSAPVAQSKVARCLAAAARPAAAVPHRVAAAAAGHGEAPLAAEHALLQARRFALLILTLPAAQPWAGLAHLLRPPAWQTSDPAPTLAAAAQHAWQARCLQWLCCLP